MHELDSSGQAAEEYVFPSSVAVNLDEGPEFDLSAPGGGGASVVALNPNDL